MLKKLGYAILFLGVLLGLSYLTPFYGEICTKSQYSNEKECAIHHVVTVWLWQFGEVLNYYSVAITALATALLAIITYLLVRLGQDQSETSRAELRAYLSVVIGEATYQEGAKKIRFEARPNIFNNGQTPAYNVRFTATAKIIPESLVPGYSFGYPAITPTSQANIGPREYRFLRAVVPDHIADTDVQDTMAGITQALWVWGVVNYDDVFGRPHFTEFCQRITWLPDGRIVAIYDTRLGRSN
jgi:hypothetical protein